MRFSIAVAAAAISVAILSPSTPSYAATPSPIIVRQCFIVPPKAMSKKPKGTQIDYVNKGPKTATSVTFAVGYRNAGSNLLRRVTDTGTFAPGAEVQHLLSLYNDVTYAGKEVNGCRAVVVTWADGSRWTSP